MATQTPNWNYNKRKLPPSTSIPNSDLYVDSRLKTIDKTNPKGYVKIFPTATTPEEGKNLEYAIQTNGKITWRVVDDDGFVRRQFNNLQELANSGYNFGFPINANNINVIKNNLNESLTKRTEEKIINAAPPPPPPSGDPVANGGTGAGGGGGGNQDPTGFNPTLSNLNRDPINLGTSTGVISAKVDGKEVKSLRYPLTMITEGENQGYPKGQDYLKIGIRTYNAIGRTLIRGVTGEFKNQISNATAHIILPIPSNIQDGNSVSYADGSLDGLTAAVADKSLNFMSTNAEGKTADQFMEDAGQSLGDLASTFGKNPALKELFLRGLAADAANLVGVGNITREQLLARESGGILNPNMELLFNGVSLRSFKFSFKLTPRDEDESKVIKAIIRVLKSNMAPKIAGQGTFLKTPSVFDLAYMQGNRSHPFLHKFKTCALTDMSVNYTGEGIYATYSDATPVSMVMDLSFKELEPIYDVDYEENDNTVGY